MALKFLNKKGWHTGSLRNIENVWKAEQKHEAEQKKLEELRKQIQDERERSEFRLLQEQAGLVPKQERLDFLYDSGLAVGRGNSASKGEAGVAFKAFGEALPGIEQPPASSSSDVKQQSAPGALFEDKPHSANDAWRKLHSDPLLLIRQREQEALARVKNNPVKMAMIRDSVKSSKEKEKVHEKKERRKKHSHGKRKHREHSSHQSDSGNDSPKRERRREIGGHIERNLRPSAYDSDHESDESAGRRRKSSHRTSRYREQSPRSFSVQKTANNDDRKHVLKEHRSSKDDKLSLEGRADTNSSRKGRESRSSYGARSYDSAMSPQRDFRYKHRNVAPKLSEEERAAKLLEMQRDAELHEEKRWKRVKKADDDDAREADHSSKISGRSFLDAAQKSVFGTEKGGSSTIEESVRRRTHYLQGRSEVGDGNAFRR